MILIGCSDKSPDTKSINQNNSPLGVASDPSIVSADIPISNEITLPELLEATKRVRVILRTDVSYRDADRNRLTIDEIEKRKGEIILALQESGSGNFENLRTVRFTTALTATVTSNKDLEFLRNHPRIVSVVEDSKNEVDLDQSRAKIRAVSPWNDDGTGTAYTGAPFSVAVIDTGVSLTAGISIEAEACFSSPVLPYQESLCANGGVSTIMPTYNDPGNGDACSASSSPDCDHGTHVASIAVGNTIVPGIAPGAGVVAIQTFVREASELFAYV